MERGSLDIRRLSAALERKREMEDRSWRAVAVEAGVPPSVVARLTNGLPPEDRHVRSLCRWLGTSPEAFRRSATVTAGPPGPAQGHRAGTGHAPGPLHDQGNRALPRLPVELHSALTPVELGFVEELVAAAARRVWAEGREV